MSCKPRTTKSIYSVPDVCDGCKKIHNTLHRNAYTGEYVCAQCLAEFKQRCCRCKVPDYDGDFAFAAGSDENKVCPNCAPILLYDFIEGVKADEYYETKGDR